jgi:hypothetical protein
VRNVKPKPMPDMAVLTAMFDLDAERGVLLRKRAYKQYKAGEVCGTRMKSGHLQTHVGGKRYLVHRIIYFMATGVDPLDKRVDHENTICDDNRPTNLRPATQAQNGSHKAKLAANNTSGHRNVSWSECNQDWRVSMTVNGRRLCHSRTDKDEAIALAAQLRHQHYGEFAGVAP